MSWGGASFNEGSGAKKLDVYVGKDLETGLSDAEKLRIDKLRQDHIIAVQAKVDENLAKDKEIARLRQKLQKTHKELNVRIRKLEEEKAGLQTEVCDLNEKLNSLSTIKRDYDAAIATIARLTAERDVLREDREKYYELYRRCQERIDELSLGLDYERNNNWACQNSIQYLRIENQKLTEERDEWKARFEAETQKKGQGDNQVDNYKFRYFVVDNPQIDEEGNVSSREDSFRRQTSMVMVNGGKRPNTDDHYQEASEVPVGLNDNQPRPRKKRFESVPCTAPRCKNCETVFHDDNSMATECSFHLAQPQPYEMWSRLQNHDSDTVVLNPRLKGHKFWPCCETHGRYRTKGCRVLKHHEVIYPDD